MLYRRAFIFLILIGLCDSMFGYKLAIVGTGYVGLATGAGLAEIGNMVTCTDIDREKIELLQQNVMPIYEQGLQELVAHNVAAGRLSFSADVPTTIQLSDVLFIAVGTPMSEDGSADLSAIQTVVKMIAQHINGYKIIVTKSTVPVGTGQQIKDWLHEYGVSSEFFDIVSNPEFLREGSAVADFLAPDRIVIGVESESARICMQTIYQHMSDRKVPIIFTNIVTSEMIKYASNSFLAVKISYINEIANFCNSIGADIRMVAKGMGLDKRIGHLFLNPGPGFGGSCFPKDCEALLQMAARHNVSLRVVQSALTANEFQKGIAIEKLLAILGEQGLIGKSIAVLGLAFKANTDDIRYSPAISTIKRLLAHGAFVRAYDPIAADNMRKEFPQLHYTSSAYEALEGADACLVMTEWPEFKELNVEYMAQLMHQKIVIDMRDITDNDRLRNAGFIVDGIAGMY